MSRKKPKFPTPVPTNFKQGNKQKSSILPQSNRQGIDDSISSSISPNILRHFLSILLIAIISISIYSNTLKNGFVYDDESTIVKNTLIKDLDNISKLFKNKEYFTTSGEMSYRPIVTLTYFIDYALYGLKPWGYHLTNLILHAINGAILYIFLTLLIQSSQSSIPVLKHNGTSFNLQSSIFNLQLIISLLFITHPVLTEAVNAISFREDGLCFLFFVSALILYLKSKMSVFCILSSIFFYLLALLSKEMAITFPLIIFLYEWIYGKQPPQSPFVKGDYNSINSPLLKGVRGLLYNPYIIGYIAITCFYLYLRFYLFHNPYEEVIPISTLSERLMTIPYLILKYIILLIAPLSLSANYMISPVQSLISLKFMLPFIIIIVFLIIVSLFFNLQFPF